MDKNKLPFQKKKPNVEEIKTPQSLVHIKHNITARQYKYWYLILHKYSELFNGKVEKDERGMYYISVKDLTERLGYEPKKSELKRDFMLLRQKPIAINYLEKDGNEVYHEMGFISEFNVSSSRVGFKFPTFIVDVLEEKNEEVKNMFLLMNWEIFNSFTGKYEAIIYKLCKDYKGVQRTPYMTIEEYREYIGLQENEYPTTDNFTRRCIKNPIKNINKNDLSDLEVEVAFSKKGRTIVGLHFTMKPKKQQTLPLEEFSQHPAFEFAKIIIEPSQQIKHLEVFTPEQVKVIIDRANEYTEQVKDKGKKANVGAIYKKAFAEGWGLDNAEYEKKAKAERLAKKKEAKAQAEAEAEEKRKHTEAVQQEQQEYIDLFNGLSEEIKLKTIEDVIESCPMATRKIVQGAYKKYGLDVVELNVPFRSEYIRMLKNHNPESE